MMRRFKGLHSGQGGRALPWRKQRLVIFVFLTIMATISRPLVARTAYAHPSETAKEIPAKAEQSASYARPIISLDEVLNPSSSMEGEYPVKVYGTTGIYYWMDNQRIILNAKDKDESNRSLVINIWDVITGKTTRYGNGDVGCYADGMIRKTIYDANAPHFALQKGIQQRGILGEETGFTFDKTLPVYITKFECGDLPSPFTTQHLRKHPEDMVVALRKEHGFLVTAKKTFLPDGRTKQMMEQNEIVLHHPGKEPKLIPIPSKNLFVAAYYSFVNKYMLYNSATGWSDIYLLSPNGEMRTVKPPAGVPSGGYPALSQRGLLWLKGSVLPRQDSGIYISSGEQVKKISSENIRSGKISPDGCRIAYTTASVDYLGTVTGPTLKVMNLCEGEK